MELARMVGYTTKLRSVRTHGAKHSHRIAHRRSRRLSRYGTRVFGNRELAVRLSSMDDSRKRGQFARMEHLAEEASLLSKPHFKSSAAARQYLEELRWHDAIRCPHCDAIDSYRRLEGATTHGIFSCTECLSRFTVTIGTSLESTRIGLHVWLQAVRLMCATKCYMSAKQLEHGLGVSEGTAQAMVQTIRRAAGNIPATQPPSFENVLGQMLSHPNHSRNGGS